MHVVLVLVLAHTLTKGQHGMVMTPPQLLNVLEKVPARSAHHGAEKVTGIKYDDVGLPGIMMLGRRT